jgi:phosphatidylethanolamine-binding protein
MVFLLATTLALSFLGLVANGKSSDDTALGIAAIQAHFKNVDIVPDLLPSFNPSAIMNVAFPGVGPISPGQNLSMPQTATAPDVTITPANSSVPTTGNFTLMMVDARAVGTNESNGQILHWLVNYATLKNESSSWPSCPSLNVSAACGVVVTEYQPPQPIVGSGPHRYVILLLPQPSSFSPPANLSKANVGPDIYFHITDYISSSHLGQPIAGMYFDVQQGPATVTIPPTSAVVTSALIPTTPA